MVFGTFTILSKFSPFSPITSYFPYEIALLFNFIYKIQEEVHRFTFSKMDAARRKRMKKTELTNVKGIGEAKAKALYEAFKTLAELKGASVEELCTVKGITPEIAAGIRDYLNKENEE